MPVALLTANCKQREVPAERKQRWWDTGPCRWLADSSWACIPCRWRSSPFRPAPWVRSVVCGSQEGRGYQEKGRPGPRSFSGAVLSVPSGHFPCRPAALRPDRRPDNDLQCAGSACRPCDVCTLCNVCTSVEISRKQTEEVCQSQWWVINPAPSRGWASVSLSLYADSYCCCCCKVWKVQGTETFKCFGHCCPFPQAGPMCLRLLHQAGWRAPLPPGMQGRAAHPRGASFRHSTWVLIRSACTATLFKCSFRRKPASFFTLILECFLLHIFFRIDVLFHEK